MNGCCVGGTFSTGRLYAVDKAGKPACHLGSKRTNLHEKCDYRFQNASTAFMRRRFSVVT